MAKYTKTAKVNIPMCIASFLFCLTLFSMLQYFPELFPQANKLHDKNIQEDEKPAPALSKDMQLYKAQRIQHAYRVNQQRHKQQKE